MKIVQIYRDAKMNDIDHKFNNKNVIKILSENSNSKGSDEIKLLYKWSYENSEILCYGWLDGEAGLENKHDLPPTGISDSTDKDSSEILLFGDLFLLKKEKNKFKNFEVSDYGEFYNIIFGGFHDCITEEESEDEPEEDEDYNPDELSEEEEDESIEYYSDNNDDDELELDNYNY
jgi:hypothetical protein